MNPTDDQKTKSQEVTLFGGEKETKQADQPAPELPVEKEKHYIMSQRTKAQVLQDLGRPPTDSAAWNEIMQKRLLEQTQASSNALPGHNPVEQPAPSEEEVKETLKKLEANVEHLQKNDRYRQPATTSTKQDDDYDDDMLPEALRQALKKRPTD